MFGGSLRKLHLSGDPGTIGREHGERLGGPVRAYLADRLQLAGDPFWSGRAEDPERIVTMARRTLEHHERFSATLYEEMVAMAGASGITPAEAVVVGGFTDVVDVIRVGGQRGIEEDDCTGLIDPGRPVLAQTWDMHASAGEYVYLFDLQPEHAPRALVQSTAGCLGQIGMNEVGIAVGINNLTSMGRVGVTWPFVVRAVLEQANLDDAVKVVLDAELAGGHNFMLMGPDGRGCNIEAMPGSRHVTRVDDTPFVHTNHCLDPATMAEEGDRNPLGVESSATRLERGRGGASDLDRFFADDEINRAAATPHEVATCGAVKMYPADGTLESVWGRPGEHPWERFAFE